MLKSRKKMLLSSIAMLLVALVALGSATFAWFTQNKEVYATGFSGKASSALGLKILSESEAATDNNKAINQAASYGPNTTLNTNGQTRVFTPVSMVPAAEPTAYKTTAISETNGARATDATAAEVTAATNPTAYNNGEYYMEKVYVLLSGDSTGSSTGTFKITNLNCELNVNSDMAPGVRFFVYYKNASGTQTLVGKYKQAAGSTVELKDTIAEGAPIVTTDEDPSKINAESVSYDQIPGLRDITDNAFTVNSTAGACYFTVVAFLDGQDATVKTENIATTNIVTNIRLDLELL